MMTRKPFTILLKLKHQRELRFPKKVHEAAASKAFGSLNRVLTKRPPAAVVISAGIVASQSTGGLTSAATASEKSIQLPPPEYAREAGASSEILLEEEYAPPAHANAMKSAKGAQKKMEHDEHSQTKQTSEGHTTALYAEKPRAQDKTGKEHEEAGDAHFGEALVEGNSGVKSVSSTAGLIWFGVVFVILVSFIYLLT